MCSSRWSPVCPDPRSGRQDQVPDDDQARDADTEQHPARDRHHRDATDRGDVAGAVARSADGRRGTRARQGATPATPARATGRRAESSADVGAVAPRRHACSSCPRYAGRVPQGPAGRPRRALDRGSIGPLPYADRPSTRPEGGPARPGSGPASRRRGPPAAKVARRLPCSQHPRRTGSATRWRPSG